MPETATTFDNTQKQVKFVEGTSDKYKNDLFTRKSSKPQKCFCIGFVILLLVAVILMTLYTLDLKTMKHDPLYQALNESITLVNETVLHFETNTTTVKIDIETTTETPTTSTTTIETTTKFVFEVESKRKLVKEMMLDSWNAYEKYAWGYEALRPVSKSAYSERFGSDSGLTIISSMSTLWVMGLKEEFEKGRKWIETKLDLSKLDRDVRVLDTIVNYVGGLLSCYALTNDTLFLEKAKEIGHLMDPAFSSRTGLPYESINPKSKDQLYEFPYLSQVGGFQLDFNYLSDASGEQQFRNQTRKILETLNQIEKSKSLYFRYISVNGKWSTDVSDPFALGRDFFTSLVKSFIQSNLKDVKVIEMYKEAVDAMEKVKMFSTSNKSNLTYIRAYNLGSETFDDYMEYSGCYLGAMLSLGANAIQKSTIENQTDSANQTARIDRHRQLAENITETCRQASIQTETGLGPSVFDFKDTKRNRTIHGINNRFTLSPELAESYFVLWRLTRDVKYREYAWELAQAIKKFCRVEESGGFSGVYYVDLVPTEHTDYQEPHFLSATLKYLYLIFSDDDEDLLPLDQWVFNVQGHPLPICGRNAVYPKSLCNNNFV